MARFDCYFAVPQGQRKVPAIVLASAIHGVDEDLKSIAGEFVAKGYIAAAPDLFMNLPIIRNMEKLEHFEAITMVELPPNG